MMNGNKEIVITDDRSMFTTKNKQNDMLMK